MNIEELAKQHQDDFPGYLLTDFYDAAFPSYQIQLQVLMQEKRPLPPVEEYVMRAIDAGQETEEEVAGMLGLEMPIVRSALNQLQRRSYATYRAGVDNSVRLHLSRKGRLALQEMLLQEPQLANFGIFQDALTARLYLSRPLRSAKTVKELKLYAVPTYRPTPRAEALASSRVQELLRESQRDVGSRVPRYELLDVIGIEKQWIEYRIMRILQFVRPDDGEILVLVFDGSERSPEHESALLAMEREMRRPLRAVSREDVPPEDVTEQEVIDDRERRAARRKASEMMVLEQQIRAKRTRQSEEQEKLASQLLEERQEANHNIEQLSREIERLREHIDLLNKEAGTTEVLQMHQHRPVLFEAFRSARRRVILVSPWMRRDAVDDELKNEIRQALGRGIEVFIGYGFGDEKSWEERFVEQFAHDVRQDAKGKFRLYRLGDVHSKVLICDESFMVISSFNWLSFAGDPTRGSRVEDGMLTRDKDAIQAKTEEWLYRFARVPVS